MAYIVADEFTNETVNSLMQYIRNNFPEECSKYDEDVLRNAILINLQNAEIEK
ncbi:unknown [Prevotella sp. CAG:255]|nr:unknown [Prevotella sp. CAG:255]